MRLEKKQTDSALPIEEAQQLNSCEPALSDRELAAREYRNTMRAAAKQIEKESETRSLAPDAYRLSCLSASEVARSYHGKEGRMSTSELVRYFSETRARRIQNADFSEIASVEPDAPTTALTASDVPEERAPIAVRLQKGVGQLRERGKRFLESAPVWFNADKPDSSREVRRFPLSAFAAVLAVAMSLMLIVASSVLLTRAESSINQLRREISVVSAEVTDLQSDLEVQSNLLQIYQIATEEYGMVSEEYIKTQYYALRDSDRVETFDEEREQRLNLSTILSAIGIK